MPCHICAPDRIQWRNKESQQVAAFFHTMFPGHHDGTCSARPSPPGKTLFLDLGFPMVSLLLESHGQWMIFLFSSREEGVGSWFRKGWAGTVSAQVISRGSSRIVLLMSFRLLFSETSSGNWGALVLWPRRWKSSEAAAAALLIPFVCRRTQKGKEKTSQFCRNVTRTHHSILFSWRSVCNNPRHPGSDSI